MSPIPANLCPECVDLLASNRLNEFDAEWISRLGTPEKQIALARKLIDGPPVQAEVRFRDQGRSRINN